MYDYELVDGNMEPDPVGTALRAIQSGSRAMLGVTVMPGPQVAPAIEISTAIRLAAPRTPIVWGGYFATLYPDAAINAPYVDYVVRGQGEERAPRIARATRRLAGRPRDARHLGGLTWKATVAASFTTRSAGSAPPDDFPPLPYHRVGNVSAFLRPSFMGTRTGVHQAAIGCRYQVQFLRRRFDVQRQYASASADRRLEQALTSLRDRYGANATSSTITTSSTDEASSVPVARGTRTHPDAVVVLCARRHAGHSRRGRGSCCGAAGFTMAYIGAEAASDALLKGMRKGTRVEHTLEVARRCRAHGVIPEFSFVLGGPEDPEGEIERPSRSSAAEEDQSSVRGLLYFYSPTPQRDRVPERAAALAAVLCLS